MTQDEQFLNGLKQIVLDNLANEQFSVEHFSEAIGLSRSHLHRRLKKLKGLSISQFIREIRLEEALKMLRQDEVSTAEIAYKVGFNSPSYFHKCFHDRYGYPPSEAKQMFNSAQEGDDVKSEIQVDRKKKLPRLYKIVAIVILLLLAGWSFYNLSKKEASPNVEKSIAVLPFENLSDDKENQYFADGLVDDLLSRLATINDFKVISRTSSDTYREKGTKKVPEIASELGVSYILEGSVRKYDNKVRITVQLIDAKHDNHVWSKSFDRDLTDIFKLQSEIALQIAGELGVILMPKNKEEIQKNRTSDFAAYEDYQLGRFHWNKRTSEGYETSIRYFKNAIAKDSLYGLAYAGLADTYNLMALQGHIDAKEGRGNAIHLAKKALKLDPSLAEAHTVLGSIYTYLDWNWELAEQEYLEAIKLNPNYSTAYHYYSEHLSIIGRHDEARKIIDKAIELDPLSFVIRWVSSKLYTGRGEFKKALEELNRCDELQKDHPWTLHYRFLIYYFQNEHSLAYEEFKKYLKASDIQLPIVFESSYSKGEMEELLNWAINTHFTNSAYLNAIRGEKGKALDILEEDFNKHEFNVESTFRYEYRNLYNEPRFKALIEKMNLP
ncbi:MAG TPA: helix-turn-helix domain-containing protein [Flavobacteriaceae bacterium]|nr:helix-turn-helix domain-containing protein [Flavobacteriaceae bacterium]